jgi:DNA-binding transcriptional regulator YiaG
MTTDTTTTKPRGRPRVRPVQPSHHADQLKALQARLGLSQSGLAQYLGVPLPTVRNWLDGLRSPPALLDRLLHVLAVVETLAPDVHGHLVPGRK